MLLRFFGSNPKLSLVTALVLVHFERFSENLLLQFVVSVQEVEHVLDEPSELKTKAEHRYSFGALPR